MKKEEAKERQAELRCMVETYLDAIKCLNNEMSELEAIINKKIEEEKPLFVTEDGVEIFKGDKYIAINYYDFSRINMIAHAHNYNLGIPYSGDVMRFKYDTNAYKYILWNKPLLSLQEIDGTVKGYLPEFDELKKIAEERIEQ